MDSAALVADVALPKKVTQIPCKEFKWSIQLFFGKEKTTRTLDTSSSPSAQMARRKVFHYHHGKLLLQG